MLENHKIVAMAGKTLSIVIPAYNEEDSIGEILTKCLAAREAICKQTGLAMVEVIAVDDGSKDKTKELAREFKDVKLVVHAVNRGYGQALMTGFEAASGDYLSFLDADGTCDPLSFIPLYQALEKNHADLSIGNRMHAGSHMPAVRILGNKIYAFIISKLTGVPVKDTASGQRVFAKELLARIYPMPSGLHFTPAMTARAACMGARITETPIPYAERQGQSKLNVVADGVRFLRVILGIIFAYFPFRIFGPAGVLFGAVGLGYGAWPVAYYLKHRRLEIDIMIYRLLTVVTLMVCSFICLAFGAVAQRVSNLATGRDSGPLQSRRLREVSAAAGLLLILSGVLLNSRTILEYVSSGRITIHWIYVLTGSLVVICGTVLASFGVTMGILGYLPEAARGKDGA